jgi:hypothetical protein
MNAKKKLELFVAVCSFVGLGLLLASASMAYAQQGDAGKSSTVTRISSTVPSNGDINPYGIFPDLA